MSGYSRRGITLTEVLVASAVAAVLVIGVGLAWVSQVRRQSDIRERGGIASEQGQAALAAALHIAKRLEQADRINRLDTDDVQLRVFIPTDDSCTVPGGCTDPDRLEPCCFDDADNYFWAQYVRDAGNDELLYFDDTDSGCGNERVLAREIVDFAVTFDDVSEAPPGGETSTSGAGDSNVIGYAVLWDDGARSHEFAGRVTSRAIPYSNVGTVANDSGRGLDITGVSPPPAACP